MITEDGASEFSNVFIDKTVETDDYTDWLHRSDFKFSNEKFWEGPLDNPDDDAFLNLAEYGLVTQPEDFRGDFEPVKGYLLEEEEFLYHVIEYRHNPYPDNLLQSFERSLDLQSWETIEVDGDHANISLIEPAQDPKAGKYEPVEIRSPGYVPTVFPRSMDTIE